MYTNGGDGNAMIESFMRTTACASLATAVGYLSSCGWDLEAAVDRYYLVASLSGAGGGDAQADDTDGVRAPIPARSDVLYGVAARGGPSYRRSPSPSVWEDPAPSPAAPTRQIPSVTATSSAPVSLADVAPTGWGSGDDGNHGTGKQKESKEAAATGGLLITGDDYDDSFEYEFGTTEETNKEAKEDAAVDEDEDGNEKEADMDVDSDDPGYGSYGDDDSGYGSYGDDDDGIEEVEPSSPRQQSARSLAELYRRPYDLMHPAAAASLHGAKAYAARQDRWLLLNLQTAGDFASQLHNRDLWANEVVAQVVRENFVFSLLVRRPAGAAGGAGYGDDEGSKVCGFYGLGDAQLPAVLVVDPVTGQMMARWSGAVKPEDFLVNVEEYGASRPSARAGPAMLLGKTTAAEASSSSSAATAAPAGEEEEQEPAPAAAVAADKKSYAAAVAAAPMDQDNKPEPTAPAPATGAVTTPGVALVENDDDDDQGMEADGEETYRLRVRFPDGKVATKEFGSKRRLARLYAYCRSVLGHGQAFQVRRLAGGAFQDLPEGGDASFEHLGLNRATVAVVLLDTTKGV